MNVYASNLDEAIDLLNSRLPQICFIGIDCEFTGLTSNADQRRGGNKYASPQEKYEKARKVANEFQVIQVGLAAFYWEDETLKALALNVNCFPQTRFRTAERRFMCEPGSLKFLVKQGVDLGRIILEGVPLFSSEEEAAFRARTEETNKAKKERQQNRKKNKDRVRPRNDAQKDFLEEKRAQMQQFIDSGEEVLVMEDVGNRFMRLMLYQLIEYEFSEYEAKKVKQDKDAKPHLEVRKLEMSREDLAKKREQEKAEEFEREISQCRGLRKIMDIIRDNNIPVVAHNALLDYLYIYRACVGYLPEDLITFQEKFHAELFPTAFDTKLFLYSHPEIKHIVESTTLGVVFEKLDSFGRPIKFSFDENTNSYDPNDLQKEHEAGFDAYMTGFVFATILGKILSSKLYPAIFSSRDYVQEIHKFVNRSHLTFSETTLSLCPEFSNEWREDFSNVLLCTCKDYFPENRLRDLCEKANIKSNVEWIRSYIRKIQQDEFHLFVSVTDNDEFIKVRNLLQTQTTIEDAIINFVEPYLSSNYYFPTSEEEVLAK